jgi:DNA gyrase/topoisomerase IV subunit A
VAYQGEDLVVISSRKAIRTSTDEVKELLRTTQGVKVIDLAEGEEVADAAVLQSDVEGEENS